MSKTIPCKEKAKFYVYSVFRLQRINVYLIAPIFAKTCS